MGEWGRIGERNSHRSPVVPPTMLLRFPRSSAVISAISLCAVTAPATALAPDRAPNHRPGANHRVGNAAIAHLDRGKRVSEKQLMHAHLTYIRRLLGARPATSPKLAATRSRLLGYLDDYIARGVTPRNLRLPWRNPVFIDEDGRICAVGYLIERSAGRALAEQIAAAHRYDYLEDIANAMPAVRAWIATSGFSLDELASIQPGYREPMVYEWVAWDLKLHKQADGLYRGKDGARGRFGGGNMEGKWTRARNGKIVGEGSFMRGAGRWRSIYPSGKRLAEGPYVANRPHGRWRFFHESGALAAEGAFNDGRRHGRWRFYYDGARRVGVGALSKPPSTRRGSGSGAGPLIATGRFIHGSTSGLWRHFDARGRLIATSREDMPKQWKLGLAFSLDVRPGKSGIRHRVHQGSFTATHQRLDMIVSRDGSERLYVDIFENKMWDARGHRLYARTASDGNVTWTAERCTWSPALRRHARRGELARVHAELYDRHETCQKARPIPAARARKLQRMTAAVRAIRAQAPGFVRRLALAETSPDDASPLPKHAMQAVRNLYENARAEDLAKVLAANMSWYIEWPHIDGRFRQVLRTLAGYETELKPELH